MEKDKKARDKNEFEQAKKKSSLRSIRSTFQSGDDITQHVEDFLQQGSQHNCCGWICYTSSLYYVWQGKKNFVSGTDGEECGMLLSCELSYEEAESKTCVSLQARREGRNWTSYRYEMGNDIPESLSVQYWDESYFSALTYEGQEVTKPKKWKYRLCWYKKEQDGIHIWEPMVGILVGLSDS